MNSITINTAPAALAGLLAKGFLHSHQDGKWRYSPYGGETVHVNDPTETGERVYDGWLIHDVGLIYYATHTPTILRTFPDLPQEAR